MDKSIGCGESSGCNAVAMSSLAKVGPIPIAAIGLLVYVFFAIIAFLRSRKHESAGTLTTIGFITAGVGTLISGYLIYASLFLIRETCRWCIASAIIMTITFLFFAYLKQIGDDGEGTDAKLDGALFATLSLACLGFLGYQFIDLKGNTGISRWEISEQDKSLTVEKLVADIDSHAMGPKDAKITIVEFADFSCPACRKVYPIVHEAVTSGALKNRVRYIYRHYPMRDKPGHQWSDFMSYAAEFAAMKGKYWEMVNYWYNTPEENLSQEKPDFVWQGVKNIGLDTEEFRKMLGERDPKLNGAVFDDHVKAMEYGLDMVPTIFVFGKGLAPAKIKGDGLIELMNRPEYQALLKD